MYIVNMFEIVCFTINDNNMFQCLKNIRLSYNIYKCASALSIRMRMPTYTVNMAVFFVKSNENTYPKGGALMQMYRVVFITKRGN